jgi:hypothetical protein
MNNGTVIPRIYPFVVVVSFVVLVVVLVFVVLFVLVDVPVHDTHFEVDSLHVYV